MHQYNVGPTTASRSWKDSCNGDMESMGLKVEDIRTGQSGILREIQ